MKNQALKKSYIIALALIILIVFMALIFKNSLQVKLTIDTPAISEGWSIDIDGQTTVIDNLPARFNIQKSESYTINKTIPASEDTLYLLVYAERQDIIVKLDDETIYTHTQETSSMSFYANLYHVIEVEHLENQSQTISITYHSPYLRSTGLVAPIYESTSPTTLYVAMIAQQIWSVVFGVLFVMIGLIVLVISHIVDRGHTEGKYYAAFFSILFGLWVISRSALLQFVTNNQYMLGGVQVTLFLVLFIPLLMFYKTSVTKRYQTQTLMLIGFYGTQSIVVTILQLTGAVDFYAPALFVAITTMIGMVMILGFVVVDVLNHNEQAKKFSRYYGILFLYSFITFANEQTFNYFDLAIYSLAVLGLLGLIILIDYIIFIEKRLKMSYLSEDYAKIAYMDRLTGSKNRHAYEEDIERLFANDNIRHNLRLVFFDFDGLKQINDQYGHIEGDYALKEGFAKIMDAFGRYGECYRIGGDEFACIIQSLDDDLYQSCRTQLIRDIKSFSTYHKFNLGISIGTSIYQDTDHHPNDMIVRADMNMYANKNETKTRKGR